MGDSVVKNDYQDMGRDIMDEFVQLKMQFPEMSDDQVMEMLSSDNPAMMNDTMPTMANPVPPSPSAQGGEAELAQMQAANPGSSQEQIMEMLFMGETMDGEAGNSPEAGSMPAPMGDGMAPADLANASMGGPMGGDASYEDRAARGVTMAEDQGSNTGANLSENMGMSGQQFSPELMQIYDGLPPELKAELAAALGGDMMGDSASADAIAQEYQQPVTSLIMKK